jgi:aspartate/methionine/tyrosine aminotransferase
MCFDDHEHFLIPKEFPEMRERTLVCNSLGKSASATGWRLGWCLHPSHLSDSYRGIHDQLCVMSPQPMQYAALSYLTLPDHYFESLADKYKKRVEKLSAALSSVGFKVIPPQGTCLSFV